MSAETKEDVPVKPDFARELEETLPEAEDLAHHGNLDEAVQRLLKLEKKARLASEWSAVTDVALAILRLSRQHGSWDVFTANIATLCKRRAQHQKVVGRVVKAGMDYLEQTQDRERRVALISTLRDVTEGRIFVEVERARLTRMLAAIREEEGDVEQAARLLQEVHVETYGTMDKLEKTDYILEQMRLCLAIRDFVRARIVSRKISTKTIDEPEFQELKLRFYSLMVQFHVHDNDTYALFEDYYAMFNTPSAQANPEKWHDALSHAVLFLVLSEHNNEQSDMLHRLQQTHRKKLEALPAFETVVKLFTAPEIAPWPLPEGVHSTVQRHAVFSPADARWEDRSAAWLDLLHRRIVQHNIRVIAKYYARLRTARLAGLLGLTEEQTERELAEMVSGQQKLFARVDRPAGIVTFTRPKPAEEILSDWSSDIGEILALVERTDHLINKERMMMEAAARAR